MMSRRLLLTVASAFALAANAQSADYDYESNYQQDYSQDGLYADYARQQQAKEVAAKA
jgi:opacity protein-like surface antigen